MFPRLALIAVALATALHAAAPSLRSYRDAATRRDGNAERGRELFFAADKAACAQCHSIDGSGSRAGPDLFAIGDKFPRRELADAILEPSASIAVGYEATVVETKSGESFYGVIKASNATSIELMGPDAKRVQIARADVTAQRPSATSLMPEGLYSALTVQEFTDLVEYLVTLRQSQSTRTESHGMPAHIATLSKPCALVPLFREELRFPASVVRQPGDVRLGLTWFGQVPGQPDVFLAAHQSGQMWIVDKREGREEKTSFADFRGEMYSRTGPNGLLGVAFHPQFAQNRRYYLKHQVFEQGQICTVLVEKIAAADLRHDSGQPSRRLLTIPCVTQNHTGGCIDFGPDGCLYLAMGDTGPQQDPNGHGQNLELLLAKILRLDVDHRDPGLPYAIPADNPFRSQPNIRPEIWAIGFREPWRFSFDSVTGDLWVGDVGQDRVEEVAIVRRGENHGWNVFEGFERFSNQHRREGVSYVAPVFAYKRQFGNSITGGYVYRGDPNSSFYDVYVCGDYTSRMIWGVTQENRVLKTVRQIATSRESIASFARDERGALYVVSYEGMVFKIDFSNSNFEDELAMPAEGAQRAAK